MFGKYKDDREKILIAFSIALILKLLVITVGESDYIYNHFTGNHFLPVTKEKELSSEQTINMNANTVIFENNEGTVYIYMTE